MEYVDFALYGLAAGLVFGNAFSEPSISAVSETSACSRL